LSNPPAGVEPTFGRYRLIRRIATGGMGEVFLAETDGPAGITKRVVIKRILPHLARDERFVERFLDEGRVMVQLSHGNLVAVFDVGVFQGQYFLVMEYVDGLDLDALRRAVAAAGDSFPPAAVAALMDMVARGLDYVHTRCDDDGRPLRIVHRDISPQNLMVARSGEVKILDFGIAQARIRLLQSLPGALAGKLAYMSPEQMQGEDAEPRTDIYALGAVAFELLSGRPPHDERGEAALMSAIRALPAPSLLSVAPEAPAALAEVVDACLASEADDRPATATALRGRLAEAGGAELLVEGETALRELCERHGDSTPRPVSFDDILVGQLGTPLSVNGQTPPDRPSTRRIGPSLESGELLLSAPGPPVGGTAEIRDSATRRGFKRWLAVAAISGILAGLGLMLALERVTEQGALLASSHGPDTELRASPDGAARASPTETPAPAATEESAAAAQEPAKGARAPGTSKTEKRAGGAAAEKGAHADSAKQPTEAVAPSPPGAAGESEPADVAPSADGAEASAAVPTEEAPPARTARPSVRIRAQPPAAEIRQGKKLLGRGSATVRGPAGKPVRLSISAPGHATKKIEVVPGRSRQQDVSLEPLNPARVELRFFPARAELSVDGRRVVGQGNRVSLELSPGRHELTLRDPANGRSRTLKIQLAPGQVRALGTLVVGADEEEPGGTQ
jgi:eukaryotic-like serine/threonine-protein kinase